MNLSDVQVQLTKKVSNHSCDHSSCAEYKNLHPSRDQLEFPEQVQQNMREHSHYKFTTLAMTFIHSIGS